MPDDSRFFSCNSYVNEQWITLVCELKSCYVRMDLMINHKKRWAVYRKPHAYSIKQIISLAIENEMSAQQAASSHERQRML